MKNRILGLKLLEEALKRPSGDCLPDHPLMHILNRQEVPHAECSVQPASTVHRNSGDRHRVQRRSGK